MPSKIVKKSFFALLFATIGYMAHDHKYYVACVKHGWNNPEDKFTTELVNRLWKETH